MYEVRKLRPWSFKLNFFGTSGKLSQQLTVNNLKQFKENFVVEFYDFI